MLKTINIGNNTNKNNAINIVNNNNKNNVEDN